MIKYYKMEKGQKTEIDKKEAIQLLSEFYSDYVAITDFIGMSVCNYEKAEKELRNIQAQLRRNPFKTIMYGNLVIRKER